MKEDPDPEFARSHYRAYEVVMNNADSKKIATRSDSHPMELFWLVCLAHSGDTVDKIVEVSVALLTNLPPTLLTKSTISMRA